MLNCHTQKHQSMEHQSNESNSQQEEKEVSVEWRIQIKKSKDKTKFGFQKWVNGKVKESYGFANSDIANVNASLIISGHEPIHPLRLVRGSHTPEGS